MASVAAFAKANYFLLGMFACVFVAAACPSLGANGGPLKPEVTINKLAVRLMFSSRAFRFRWTTCARR